MVTALSWKRGDMMVVTRVLDLLYCLCVDCGSVESAPC